MNDEVRIEWDERGVVALPPANSEPVFGPVTFEGSEVYGALIYADPPRSRRLRLLNRLRRLLGREEQAEVIAWWENRDRYI
jgi:hypothetical protein